MFKLLGKLDWIRLETEFETERRTDEIRRENRQNTHGGKNCLPKNRRLVLPSD